MKTQKSKTKHSAIKAEKKIPKSVLLPHKCPTCKTTADTTEQAKDLFGLRNMGDKIRCQSYCRVCRTKHGRKMDKLRDKNPKLEKLDLRTTSAQKKIKKAKA